MPRGMAALADVEAIRANRPDAETVALAAKIAHAERSAEATAEAYLVNAGGLIEALHHCLSFSQELQKLALDARTRSMTNHMVGPNGEKPTGTTINAWHQNLLTHVLVHATSRPNVRCILDDIISFVDVVREIGGDVHCDAAEEPFVKSLAPHFPPRFKLDCIAQMAEDAATQRKCNDYNGKREPVSVGILLPVAFSNEIVVLKLCYGHALAFAAKYGIQLRNCGIDEPWESVGNYW
ncbi:hypothetical protein EAH80_29355 [Mycobacterium hodleri]|uniref:Uncharacterized protein n=2 Tax=Mycolicibacterium hodleri TaxID=49897 RepID=A0A502DLJ4_9MYCO|nr:hypothetical protein EAH80_29355 [Mycolicibacterium hodleri]